MSLSVVFHGSVDGDDGPFQVASATGWARFGEWVESLPHNFMTLRRLMAVGEVKDSSVLSGELHAALIFRRPLNPAVLETARQFQEILGAGDVDEVVTISADADAPVPDEVTTNAHSLDAAMSTLDLFLRGGASGVANVFCPTGPGGGVDPSCSWSSGGVAVHGTTTEHLDSILSNGIHVNEAARVYDPVHYQGDRSKSVFVIKSDHDSLPEDLNVMLNDGGLKDAMIHARAAALKNPNAEGVVLILRIPKGKSLTLDKEAIDGYSYYGDRIAPEHIVGYVRLGKGTDISPGWTQGLEVTRVRNEDAIIGYLPYVLLGKGPAKPIDNMNPLVTSVPYFLSGNAFCPTGAGGGVDPSCSPGGVGTVADAQHAARQARIALALSGPIERAEHLSAVQKAEYKAAVSKVIGSMSPKALDRLSEGVKRVTYHSDVVSLTRSVATRDPAIGEWLRDNSGPGKTLVVKGMYTTATNHLDLDGASTLNGVRSGPEHFMAHEMWHALDKGHAVSNSREWQVAWHTEMRGERLTKMAGTSSAEAFAEFGRLLSVGGKSHEEIRKAFPRASAVIERHGLWPMKNG